MKLKKVLSGFLAAAIAATTTAIVMPISASAAEENLGTFSFSVDGVAKDTAEVDSSSWNSVWTQLAANNNFTWAEVFEDENVYLVAEIEFFDTQVNDWQGNPTNAITGHNNGYKESWYGGDVKFGTTIFTVDSEVEAGQKYSAKVKLVESDFTIDNVDQYDQIGGNFQAASDGYKTVHSVSLVRIAPEVVAVESVTLDETELALKKGETATLTATVAPADATDKTVTWTSSKPEIATVDNTGKVTAVASGATTITVTSVADETKKATCEVTVTNPATAIAIDETASVLVGAEKALTVTTDPADADELTYTWTSSKPEIATVTNGVVTGVAAGEAVITAKAGALEASCTVTVTADTKPATAVTISKETLELEVEGTETLTATITPADSTDSVVWSTSNPEIATVANGKVTAVAEGSATITATAGDVMAECKVTVKAKPVEIETKAYELGIVDASGWGEDGVKQAAQTNQKVSITGITFGKSTYSDVKGKTLKLDGLAFGSCSADGVKAENVDVSLYAQFGDTWSWKSIGGKTLADGSIEWDMSTIEGVKDTDVIQEIGFQFNIKGNVGGINDMAATTKVILNAAEPKFTVVGEEPAEKSDYETGDVEKVKDYVPATTETGKKTELVVMSITEAEAERAESYTITVKTSDGKEKTFTTNDCYKGFKYNTASGEKTEKAANGYFIIVKVTGVPEGVTVNVTIEATK